MRRSPGQRQGFRSPACRHLPGRALLGPLGLSVILAALQAAAASAQTRSYPMVPAAWALAPPVGWAGNTADPLRFARYEGMPTGILTVNEAIAVSTDARFSSGTIEFDIKPLAYSDTGIIFRRRGSEDGEIVYLRANPECPAADDCIQYAPITHALMQWDIYPEAQGPAPVAPQGWNHVRIVVAGEAMLVYVNRQAEPSLVVPKLQGLSTDGGIAFKGPAIYANLVIRAGDPPALPDVRQPPAGPGTVTAWLAAEPTVRAAGRPVLAADIPAVAAWHPIGVEPTGLVNLSRAFGTARAPAISIGWLKTELDAVTAARRTVRIGWARQVSVFLNGRLVFSGDNPYYPSEQRLTPDGRLDAGDAVVPLDLRPGRNEIVLAVGNGWRTHAGVEKASPYGWGAEAHLDWPAGAGPSRP